MNQEMEFNALKTNEMKLKADSKLWGYPSFKHVKMMDIIFQTTIEKPLCCVGHSLLECILCIRAKN
jgi:hypothetical protein